MRQPRICFLSLLAVLCLIAAACGSTAVTSTAQEVEPSSAPDTGPETSEAIDLSVPINEQDLDQARAALDGARAQWDGREPFAFTLQVGIQAVNGIEIDFDADGNPIAERVVLGDPDEDGFGVLPRSVDDVFDRIENALVEFETGALPVPPAGDCGNHFNAEFDEALGSPTYFDTLGPCDDGVGLRIAVTPVE